MYLARLGVNDAQHSVEATTSTLMLFLGFLKMGSSIACGV